MNLSLRIARRYLLARKSTNAINLITGIAIFGVAVGSAALILVLSVFNGFEDLFLSMYNDFNPDVRITPARGKTFDTDETLLATLQSIEGVQHVSETLEEIAFFDYKDNQSFGLLRGVDDNYILVNHIDSTIREGSFRTKNGERNLAVVGMELTTKLGIDLADPLSSLSVYMAKRRRVAFGGKQFNTRLIYPQATFQVQQDMDNQFVLTNIELVRQLLEQPDATSALEVRLYPGFGVADAIQRIQQTLGEDFVVKDRYAQEAAFMRLMNIEKWISFAIAGLMMLLISFNIVGALWMIVLEKQKDIVILKSMGMTDQQIRLLFLQVGLLLCGLGLVVGFLLAAVIYFIQTTVGIITLPGGMLVDAYPVSMRWYDFPVVALLVLIIGYLASLLPARRARAVEGLVREA